MSQPGQRLPNPVLPLSCGLGGAASAGEIEHRGCTHLPRYCMRIVTDENFDVGVCGLTFSRRGGEWRARGQGASCQKRRQVHLKGNKKFRPGVVTI